MQCSAVTKSAARCTKAATQGTVCTQHFKVLQARDHSHDTLLSKFPGSINDLICSYLTWHEFTDICDAVPELKFSKQRIYEEPYTGFTDEHYKHIFQFLHRAIGSCATTSTYADGELVQLTIYCAGRRRYMIRYKDGLFHGLQQSWSATGTREFMYRYTAGMMNGVQLEYDGHNKVYSMWYYTAGELSNMPPDQYLQFRTRSNCSGYFAYWHTTNRHHERFCEPWKMKYSFKIK